MVSLCCSLVGCGNTLYAIKIGRASGSFEEARTLGAEHRAPYEYYAAKVRLDEARRQAAKAEYGDATELADEADEFSRQAIRKMKSSGSQTATVTSSSTAEGTTP